MARGSLAGKNVGKKHGVTPSVGDEAAPPLRSSVEGFLGPLARRWRSSLAVRLPVREPSAR